jgi:predicted nucleic acid-binding protein
MKIPTIYLETTIFNFPFVDDAPQYKADTLQLFEKIRDGTFKAFTSEYVKGELEDTKDMVKRERMKALIAKYGISVIPMSEKAEYLADAYVISGIIPKNFLTDAIHIATATVAGIDFIVSLNFKHIVKQKTIMESENINIREGYKRIFIYTPAEVINHDKQKNA